MQKLLEIAKQRFAENVSQLVPLSKIEESNIFLNDLVHYPHAYVLACMMDRQINADQAWNIPYRVCDLLDTRDLNDLAAIPENVYIHIFEKYKLHRFNTSMAKVFHSTLVQIRDVYEGDASKIWSGNPSSATVVYRFLQFHGSGVKIATMAANILARQFRISFSDYYSIDISPDVHVKLVLSRLGMVDKNASNDQIIYKAREIYPEFPGIIDFSCWEIGKYWCHPTHPDCDNCIMKEECHFHQQSPDSI